ncbi:aspartate/glutamate racemase family protein [Arthrobacter globiformis]|uniref:aspartate/glutamate racemase family protein n=1 Tax=Arthrobacter globiformis TaxID=1665 RepID=UPI000B414D23|nr:aspartate/glutamate racemase family protein [Arthrobacter globiformis]
MATDTTPSRSRVLLINPNSNRRTTDLMTGIAEKILAPEGLEVVGLTATEGPDMIIDPVGLQSSVKHVQTAVHHYLDGPDGSAVVAVIVAAIGDPGRVELARNLNIPVVGIGQGAIRAAAGPGRRFGMATSTPLLADSLASLVEEHGQTQWFTGVRLTPSEPLVLAAEPEKQFQELLEAVKQSSRDDGAQAVIIAGGPLSETAQRIAATGTAEIIQPVPSACSLVLNAINRQPLATHGGE